jgi:C-lobe and N-lobe beta barrels of Tf-binding protein B
LIQKGKNKLQFIYGNTKSLVKLNTIALLASALFGCGGGGGGGVSNVSPTPIHVTSAAIGVAPAGAAKFGTAPSPAAVISAANAGSALTAGTATAAVGATTGLAGLSVSFPLNFNNSTNTGVTGAVSIDPSFSLSTTGATVAGGITSLTAIGINAANATTTGNSLSFNNADLANAFGGNTSAASGHLAVATATSYYDILVISLISSGLSYTQFGDWSQCSANCAVAGGTASVNGVYVWGDATAPANIPPSGTATYSGFIAGNYISSAGTKTQVSGSQGTSGNMTAIVNFGARSISFSTSGTTGGAADNMSGTLTYAPNQNLFAGTVTSATMTGTAAGRFYGPAAQEIGGVYSLSGGGAGHYGAFIGKK